MDNAIFLEKAKEVIWVREGRADYNLKHCYNLAGKNIAVLISQNRSENNELPRYDWGDIILAWEDVKENKILYEILGIPYAGFPQLIKDVILKEFEGVIKIVVEVETWYTADNFSLPCSYGYSVPIDRLRVLKKK